jgi:hypothetical protein
MNASPRFLRVHRRPTPSLARAALAAALGLALAGPLPAAAQAVTSAFTYQGELRAGGNPASANFDMEFRLFNAATGGTQIGPVVTRLNVPAVNGLFNVQLDFGPSQFAGDRQWLEVRIKPAGSGSYETLSPRTEVTATPYALGAVAALPNSVTTTSIVDGTIGTADIDATQIQRRVTGSCPTGQYVRVVAQDGTVTCGTDATGTGTVTSIATGAGLTGGPITTSGTIAVAPGGIGAAQINDTQVQRRVTGTCTGTNYLQQVNADGTVGCGPAPAASGWSLTGNLGTNPATNFIGTTDAQPFVVRTRNAQSLRIEPSTILFGGNPITANVIAGSSTNNVAPGVRGATIAGGGIPSGDSDPDYSGEGPNRVNGDYGTVGGGYNNQAGSGQAATVGGGIANAASGGLSTVGGGSSNNASGGSSTIGGGSANVASGNQSTVGGGSANVASADSAIVAGGSGNVASANGSAVAGGSSNQARGQFGIVSGGLLNCAGGSYSWVGGYRAKVRPGVDPGAGACGSLGIYPGGPGDQGTFIWADSQNFNFVSTGENQFLVRADGGFGFNTSTIPTGIEAVFRSRTGPNEHVDLYLRPASHGRGINIAMIPGAGAAGMNIAQYDGTTFVDRILLASNGDFTVTAQAFKPGGGSWAVPSDARLKADVEPLAGTLDRLLQLRGVRYAYRPEVTPKAMYLPGPQVGFIAQEVERVFPDWVSEGADGYKTVGPRGFEALTVEALRELRAESAAIDGGQSARIAALEAENAKLRTELDRRDAEYRARLERLESLIAGRGGEER